MRKGERESVWEREEGGESKRERERIICIIRGKKRKRRYVRLRWLCSQEP